jgi:hypothetical protein
MPRAVTVLRTPNAIRERMRQVERVRGGIPIAVYLEQQHRAIATGHFPDFDPATLEFTGTSVPVDVELRVKMSTEMIERVVPKLSQVRYEYEPSPEPEEVLALPGKQQRLALTSMSSQQLQDLIRDADPDAIPDPGALPSSTPRPSDAQFNSTPDPSPGDNSSAAR